MDSLPNFKIIKQNAAKDISTVSTIFPSYLLQQKNSSSTSYIKKYLPSKKYICLSYSSVICQLINNQYLSKHLIRCEIIINLKSPTIFVIFTTSQNSLCNSNKKFYYVRIQYLSSDISKDSSHPHLLQ